MIGRSPDCSLSQLWCKIRGSNASLCSVRFLQKSHWREREKGDPWSLTTYPWSLILDPYPWDEGGGKKNTWQRGWFIAVGGWVPPRGGGALEGGSLAPWEGEVHLHQPAGHCCPPLHQPEHQGNLPHPSPWSWSSSGSSTKWFKIVRWQSSWNKRTSESGGRDSFKASSPQMQTGKYQILNIETYANRQGHIRPNIKYSTLNIEADTVNQISWWWIF